MKVKYKIYDEVRVAFEESRFREISLEVDIPYEVNKLLTIITKLNIENKTLEDAINDIRPYFLSQLNERKFTGFKKLSIIFKNIDNRLSNDEKKFVIDYILKKNQEYINGNNVMCDYKDLENFPFKFYTAEEVLEYILNGEVGRVTYKYEIEKRSLNNKEKELYIDVGNFLNFTNSKYKTIYETIDELYFNCQKNQLYDISSIIDALKQLDFDDYLCEIIQNYLESKNRKTENRVKNKAIKNIKKMESTKINLDEGLKKEIQEKRNKSLDKFMKYINSNEKKLNEAMHMEKTESDLSKHDLPTILYRKELQIHLLLTPIMEYIRHLNDVNPYFYNGFSELSEIFLTPEAASNFTDLEKMLIFSYLILNNIEIIKKSKEDNTQIQTINGERNINYEAYLKLDELYFNSMGINEIDINAVMDNLKTIGVKEKLAESIRESLVHLYYQQLNKERERSAQNEIENSKKDNNKVQIDEPKVSLREKKKIYYNLQRIFDFDNMEAKTYLAIDTQIECIKDLKKIGLFHLVEEFFLTMYNYNKDLIDSDDNIILKIINCDNILTYLQDFINLGLDKYISLLEPFFIKAYKRLRVKEPITYYQVMYNKVLYYKEKYNIDMKSIEDNMKKMIMPENEFKYNEAKEFVTLFVDDLPEVLNNDITYEKEKALELLSKD